MHFRNSTKNQSRRSVLQVFAQGLQFYLKRKNSGLYKQGPSVPDWAIISFSLTWKDRNKREAWKPQANFVQNGLRGVGRKVAVYRK